MSTLRRGRDGGLDKLWVRRGVAKLRCGEGLCRSIAVLRRGIATIHSMEIFFVFILFLLAQGYLSLRF